MNVKFTSEALEYLEDLVTILYQKEYFGFLETSKKYVEDLIDDIKTNLPKRQHKLPTKYFDRYGKDMLYASFRKNKQTEWYAFFSKYIEDGNTGYLVRHIENNHTAAQYLE